MMQSMQQGRSNSGEGGMKDPSPAMPAIPTVVVLVPGIWIPATALHPLAWAMRRAGHRTLLFGYRGVRDDWSDNVRRLERFLAMRTEPRIDIVAHSLGGLLVGACLAACPALPQGRVVLLGSPWQGSAVARRIARLGLAGHLLGGAAEVLQQGYRQAWPDGREVGVIAGTGHPGLGQLLLPGLASPHDGTVSLCETRVPGVCDSLALPLTHSGLLFSRQVAQQVGAFLAHGRFRHPGAAGDPGLVEGN